MEEVSENMKAIFEKGSEAGRNPDCKVISLMEVFVVNETVFYVVRYEGIFKQDNGKTLAYLYACFAEGETESPVCETEFEAQIDAICRMESLTVSSGRSHYAR